MRKCMNEAIGLPTPTYVTGQYLGHLGYCVKPIVFKKTYKTSKVQILGFKGFFCFVYTN